MENLKTLIKDLDIRSVKDLVQAKLDNKLPDLELHFNLYGNLYCIQGYYKGLDIPRIDCHDLTEFIEANIPKRELAIDLIDKYVRDNNIESKARLVECIIRENCAFRFINNWYTPYVEIDSSLKVTKILFKNREGINYRVPLKYLDSILAKEEVILL